MSKQEKWTKERYEAFNKAWAKIIAKAWSDDAFKQKLLKDPLPIFKEYGIEFRGMTCKIHENTEKVIHFSLPEKPPGEITEESLKKISGAGQYHSNASCG